MLARVETMRRIVDLGFTVLFSDSDVIWKRDPIPYFQRVSIAWGLLGGGRERKGSCCLGQAPAAGPSDRAAPARDPAPFGPYAVCRTMKTHVQYPKVDVLVQTDAVYSSTPGEELEVLGPTTWSTNAGLLVVRPRGRPFLTRWLEAMSTGLEHSMAQPIMQDIINTGARAVGRRDHAFRRDGTHGARRLEGRLGSGKVPRCAEHARRGMAQVLSMTDAGGARTHACACPLLSFPPGETRAHPLLPALQGVE